MEREIKRPPVTRLKLGEKIVYRVKKFRKFIAYARGRRPGFVGWPR